MKHFLILCLLTGVTALGAQSALPNVTVKTLSGQSIRLDDAVSKGKITVISFWATWCSPCKKELDAMKSLYDTWKEDYNVEIIAISTDDTRSLRKVKPMVGERGWKYTILTDEKQDLLKALNFQTIPQTFLLDKNKKIVYSHNGYVSGDEYELEEQIKKHARM